MGLKKRPASPVPEVNLIPMLTVMMGVLAFFVVVTMTLTSEQGIESALPPHPDTLPPAPAEEPPAPLNLVLTVDGQVLANGEPLLPAQVVPQVRAYLAQSTEGVVVLTADPQLPYAEVVTQLGELKEVAGDRVALVIDDLSSVAPPQN